MKKVLFFIVSICFVVSLNAQNIGVGLRGYISNQNSKNNSNLFSDRYAIRNFDNMDYLATIIKVNENFSLESLSPLSCKIGARVGNILTLYIPLCKVNDVLSLKGLEDIECSRKVSSPLINKAKNDVNADLVNQGFELPKGFSGKDVIIGITDWGFDYTHPVFYDTSMTNYRVIAAWDQYRKQGPAPSGFLYGTVFQGKNQLLGAQSDTLNIYNIGTHGTHVGGIASGAGAGTIYRGVAYDANLLFATFLIDEAAVLDAYAWMRDVAIAQGKPLVINGSWGIYHFGLLDGTSLMDQAIGNLSSQNNVVFVSAGGNNGNDNFHLNARFSNNEIKKSSIEFNFGENMNPNYWGQTITMMGDSTDRFSTRLEFYDGSLQLIDSTQWVNTITNDVINNNFIITGGDSIIFRVTSQASTPISHRPIQEWEVRISNYQLNKYYIVLAISSPSGRVHAWNVAALTTGVGNWGMRFLSLGPNYIYGDKYYGLGEPTVADEMISVAAYTAKERGSLNGGARAMFSSIGPRIDGVLKPEVAAPGVSVISSLNSFATDIETYPTTNSVVFNERTYRFYPFSGTSMSSPVVTGVVALMLEANPNLSPSMIKDVLKQTARVDEFTGSTIPNNSWGWGKIDALAAVKRSIQLIGLNDGFERSSGINFYPNPAKDKLYINSSSSQSSVIRIFDVFGKLRIEDSNNSKELDISSLEKGFYIISFIEGEKKFTAKLVIH